MTKTSKKDKEAAAAAKKAEAKKTSQDKAPAAPVPKATTKSGGRPPKASNKENANVAEPNKTAASTEAPTSPANKDSEAGVASDEVTRLQKLLDKANAKLEKTSRKRKREKSEKKVKIERLERPKGESGSKKKGFNLQDAMGLKDNTDLYNSIKVCSQDLSPRPHVTDCVLDASLTVYGTVLGALTPVVSHAPQNLVHTKVNSVDFDAMQDFRNQDAEKLAIVYRRCRTNEPYLTRDRFPRDWAIAELTKNYLRSTRIAKRKKAKKTATAAAAKKNGGGSSEEDDDDDNSSNSDSSSSESDSSSEEEDVVPAKKQRTKHIDDDKDDRD